MICYCADPTCSTYGCKQLRPAPYGCGPQMLPQIPETTPRGCICPPGSEKTCEGIGCPRQNPLKQKA